jgi:hypothetical protein
MVYPHPVVADNTACPGIPARNALFVRQEIAAIPAEMRGGTPAVLRAFI